VIAGGLQIFGRHERVFVSRGDREVVSETGHFDWKMREGEFKNIVN
jgi:hypothetical protein